MGLSVHQFRSGNKSFAVACETSVKSDRIEDILYLSPIDMTADTALSLDGTGRLDYSLKQGPKRDVLLKQSLQGVTSDPGNPSSLEVKFRTRSKSGTLLHVQESSNYTTVKVRKQEEVKVML